MWIVQCVVYSVDCVDTVKIVCTVYSKAGHLLRVFIKNLKTTPLLAKEGLWPAARFGKTFQSLIRYIFLSICIQCTLGFRGFICPMISKPQQSQGMLYKYLRH